MKNLLFILVAIWAALFSPGLRADDYPSRSISLVNVFGPGSASDTICRVIAEPLGIALKQSVICSGVTGRFRFKSSHQRPGHASDFVRSIH